VKVIYDDENPNGADGLLTNTSTAYNRLNEGRIEPLRIEFKPMFIKDENRKEDI